MTLYGIIIVSNITASSGVDFGPRVEGESDGNEEFADYHARVGSLVWISVMTRPNIMNVLRTCARHIHNPTARHWKALLQIAAYVNELKEIVLKFVRDHRLMISMFVDSDHAAASTNRRSVSGVAIILGKIAVELYEETCSDFNV